jgi:hypothetical protein
MPSQPGYITEGSAAAAPRAFAVGRKIFSRLRRRSVAGWRQGRQARIMVDSCGHRDEKRSEGRCKELTPGEFVVI